MIAFTVISSSNVHADRWKSGAGSSGESYGSGTLLLGDETGGYHRALHLGSKLDVSVNGVIARVTFRQSFRNVSDEWLEGRYVFPLMSKSAVDRLVIEIGERRMEGDIKPRKEAEKSYRTARASGQRAALLSAHRDNLFSTKIANIGPGATITVEISWLQPVDIDNSIYRLRLPLTLTPRYVPGVSIGRHVEDPLSVHNMSATTQVDDAAQVTPPQTYRSRGGELADVAELNIALNAGVELAEIASRYHDLEVSSSGHRYQVVLEDGSVAMDRDVVLEWRPAESAVATAALFEETIGDEHFGLLVMMPPSIQGAIPRSTRELILVIDTSGSMAGESIRQAQSALMNAVDRLTQDDRFNIIEFNSRTRSMFAEAVPANHKNLNIARRFIRQIVAGGGTEIAPALALALGNPGSGNSVDNTNAGSNRLRQVVFITDGAVANEEALLGRIHRTLGAQRLFTVGIGSSPNSYFMRKAARFGRGSFIQIGDTSEVSESMGKLFEKLEHPALTSIDINWPDDAEVYPQITSDLYRGEPVISLARYRSNVSTFEVSGRAGKVSFTTRPAISGVVEQSGVATLWARQKIESLLDSLRAGADIESVRPMVTEVALQHRIATRFTSFVAIDKTPARPENLPMSSRHVANRMPAGSIMGASQAIALPVTANGHYISIVIALLLLLASMLMYVRRPS
ncbi:MAG: marine proteobacterial sortase target protein [marine bacterium B5-7]|nr:MAG: marine proteobacterial sortase target protein [marine bacterium B5-7]